MCVGGARRALRADENCRRGARCVLWRELLSLWMALASPIDALDDYLLAAHMIQHFILMSIAPPLIVLGAPAVPMLRGMPQVLIRGLLRPLFRAGWIRVVWHAL